MTPKQRKDYLHMKQSLERIRTYQRADKLRKCSKKDYGLDYEEALEMSYENILDEANEGLKGVRNLTDLK